MKSLTDMAADSSVSTEQVLVALRVVAARAGITELADWAAKELEGYEANEELPPHRIWSLTITGSLHNPVQGLIKNALLGDMAINHEYREKVTRFHCRSGIGELEAIVTARKDQTPLGAEHPNLAELINREPRASPGWVCVEARATFSPLHIMGVVNKARQTALNLCLECESRGIALEYYDGSTESNSENRDSWLKTLKDEGTKIIIRDAWTKVSEFFLSMGTAGN